MIRQGRTGGGLRVFFNTEQGHGVDFICNIPQIISKLCSQSRSGAGLGVAILNLTLTAYKALCMILMISKNLYVEHIQSTLKAVKAMFNIATLKSQYRLRPFFLKI